jgi:hypothetical protein
MESNASLAGKIFGLHLGYGRRRRRPLQAGQPNLEAPRYQDGGSATQ